MIEITKEKWDSLLSERDELKAKVEVIETDFKHACNRTVFVIKERDELKKEVERLKAQVEGFKEHIAHDARNLHLDPSQYYRD